MKKLIGASFTLLIITYCSLWWYFASQLKTTTLDTIAHINQHDGVQFKYDQIQLSGFPWRITTKIHHAQLTINNSSSQYPIIPQQIHIEFDQNLRLESSVFSKTITVISNKLHIKTDKDNYTQLGARKLAISFFNTPTPETFIEQIQSLEFTCETIRATDQDNHPVVIAEPLELRLERHKLGHDQERYTFHINGHYTDEITAKQILLNSIPYLTILSSPKHNTSSHTISDNNSINADITLQTFSLSTLIRWLSLGQVGEVYLQDELMHTPPIIDINNLHIRTPWFNWQANFHSDAEHKADQRNLHLHLHSKFTMTQEGQHLLNQRLENLIPTVSDKAHLQKIQSILPNLVDMGTIQYDLELNSTPQTTELKTLNLSNEHYGIQGNLLVNTGKSGHAKFELRNHRLMIDDALAFCTSVSKLANYLQISNFKLSFSPDLNQQLDRLLRKLAIASSSKNNIITLSIQYDGHEFSIGNYHQQSLHDELKQLKKYIMVTRTDNDLPTKPLPYINDQSFLDGIHYQDGQGRAVNNELAVKYYRIAIKNTGDDRAMNNLAVLLAQGKGTPKNIAAAKELFQSAAELGNTIAEINLQNLTNQKSYPALIHYTSAFTHSVTCEQYDREAIDNILTVFKAMNWQEIVFIREGQPGAMPNDLRSYAIKKATAMGFTILRG